jgi:hypothetical protein
MLNKKTGPSRWADYFDNGGETFLDMRYFTMEKWGDNGGMKGVCHAPVACGFNISKKYLDAARFIQEHENSAYVPDSVKKALKDFETVLEEDKAYMSTLINALQPSVKEFIMHFDDQTYPIKKQGQYT